MSEHRFQIYAVMQNGDRIPFGPWGGDGDMENVKNAFDNIKNALSTKECRFLVTDFGAAVAVSRIEYIYTEEVGGKDDLYFFPQPIKG